MAAGPGRALAEPDPDSLRYAHHWEPVLTEPAHRVLDRIPDEPARFLDLGAGTGSLSMSAAHRWPDCEIISLDASSGMLSVLRQRASEASFSVDRLEIMAADAAAIPLPDDSVDAVGSSFVLQLVSDRNAVLREVRRVLRPGGMFSFVTWLADDLSLPAEAVFTDALEELGIDDDADDGDHDVTEYRSLAEAGDELLDAGYNDVRTVQDLLDYAWTPDGFLDFKTDYDDHDLVDGLPAADRDRLVRLVRSRWALLPESDFRISGNLVAATARVAEASR